MVYLAVILIWRFGESRKIAKLTVHHYQAIRIASMSVFP